MLFTAIDWSTISSLATAVGTLVLAIATFAAVRSSNRSARIAELALRDPDDPVRAGVVRAIEAHEPITVELLYTDQVGGERTISRFGLQPYDDVWLSGLSRHWYLDWEGPRSESLTIAASEVIRREH